MTATSTTSTVAEATAAAAAAAPALAATSDVDRARFLAAIADAIDAAAVELVSIAQRETHLPEARLTGEVARTTAQLRMFARVIVDGAYLEATIDHPNSEAVPPNPDLRRVLKPIGPVGVFSASNFPFAFSVAGGDTASALAVGCPVVVKAHSGHTELSRRTAEIVSAALEAAGAPAGSFSLVEGRQAGTDLVQDRNIKAVGFTGSLSGGRALFDLASSRPDPIPFYGELGSINPVVITEAAALAGAQKLATGLVGSFTLGVGQFCTKPGVVLFPAGTGFEDAVVAAFAEARGGEMLTERIAEAYPAGLQKLAAEGNVKVLAGEVDQDPDRPAEPVVLLTTAAAVAADPQTLLEECFGPVTLLVAYHDTAERDAALDVIEGSLTATLHAAEGEHLADLAERLAARAGRVLFGGWPTGVAVTWSQQHGGPWPATTSIHTSVGATAGRRFQRPVTYQDAPESVLPEALREQNTLGIWRRIDGELGRH
ncbi:aldehyde dehydrogenase (NADP(+)) [Microlunatus panaciterrae]|uniref:NADP-dependent aldehyde dehydrogenase n=1 Tax=Microlunatus panaciterrae TaxID=400768 RepID=A0ABS2RIU2_9ACTN|nr:NADP-dependent aldehyde dehydrogenase [Microlunatus panaciterrae]